jgi:hypothetical protein
MFGGLKAKRVKKRIKHIKIQEIKVQPKSNG